MDDFEAFRKKKLGKDKGGQSDQGPVDDFEAFRKKKLQEKQKGQSDAERSVYYEWKVEEEGKAEGLTSHRQKLHEFSGGEVPDIKSFKSHMASSHLDPGSIEKFGGKKFWGDDIPRVDPGSVEKIKGRYTHIVKKIEEIDEGFPDNLKGIKRY